ncbi:NAD(P)H-dependent oxidoreductase [Actinomyces viscosus]|uniref:NAD(P)H-dependent oxidoreductase n=1 Tax=Actinomyces viscosus TaxID=1656 RepID=UPI0028E55B4E|nr:NAD(P)H-dependent oxidoreductase [Actinomyces viscosus]
MHNLIVFDHPYGCQASENEPHNRSFSAALYKSVRNKLEARGESVDVIDLAADGFNPVMSAQDLASWRKGVPMDERVADYQRRLAAADRLILIFPVWWELMPASTKGFIDKVYAKDILYTAGEGRFGMRTRLPGTEVVAITTMGTPVAAYKYLFGKPLVKALSVGLCRKTGMKRFRWIPFSGVDRLTLEQRQKMLAEVRI